MKRVLKNDILYVWNPSDSSVPSNFEVMSVTLLIVYVVFVISRSWDSIVIYFPTNCLLFSFIYHCFCKNSNFFPQESWKTVFFI